MKKLIFILLFCISTAHSISISNQDAAKIYILAVINSKNLRNNINFSTYYSENYNSTISSSELRNIFSQLVQSISSGKEEIKDSESIYNTYGSIIDYKAALVLYHLAVFENKKKEFTSTLSSAYMAHVDNITFVNDNIENFSKNQKTALHFTPTINFNKNLSITFHPQELADHLRFSSNERKYIKLFKHSFRQLMQKYKINDSHIKILWSPEVGGNNHTVAPLQLYMSLLSKTGKTLHHYFGDFSPSGEVRPWGYMPSFYQTILDESRRTIFIPVNDLQNLKDSIVLKGSKAALENHFIGVKNLSDLIHETLAQTDKSKELYSTILKEVKSKKLKGNALLKKLDEVLKINPNHFSALIYKEMLLRKFSSKLSLVNSFFEFERIYYQFKNEQLLERLKPRDPRSRAYRSEDVAREKAAKEKHSAVMKSMVIDIAKLEKVAHSDIRPMCKYITDNIKLYNSLTPLVNDKKSKNKMTNLLQKYFKNLRTLNLKRDLLIDSQKAIDGIFIR
jgi:hypothetical protein